MANGRAGACYLPPDGRLYVGAPHNLATPRTTQDPGVPEYGGGPPSMYSTRPGQRDETMWVQPAFCVLPGMPARHAQPEIARGLYEVSGSALPTFFPVGNRAGGTVHSDTGGNYETAQYLVVPPDRYNALANSQGGNRRGRHDVRLRGFTDLASRRVKVPAAPVGA